MSIESKQPLPPLIVEYTDGETFVERHRPLSADRQKQLATICMDAIMHYGATVTNPLPVYVGSQESLYALKVQASRQNRPLQFHRSDGTCGIME